MKKLLLFLPLLFLACKSSDTSVQLATTDIREFKVLDSNYLDKDQIFGDLLDEVVSFRESDKLKGLILEKSIPEIKEAIASGQFSYRDLTLFYLKRIYTYDRENPKSLNAVIAINPNALKQADAADQDLAYAKKNGEELAYYSIKGMPILLKDNINTKDMPTTSGAAVLINNTTAQNAQIVNKLRQEGAVILGKTNLSEWAYFFCGDCPSGYSAVGGQTLNPYGRRTIDTGGSSSGSGVSVAANFAVAAIGSETSGSILSPSSQNSVVGYKPTTGTFSGVGIVPISSYLDTAGPMTKNVMDNAILAQALGAPYEVIDEYGSNNFETASLKGVRFAVWTSFKENPLYAKALLDLEESGAVLIEVDNTRPQLNGFLKLLNADMKKDLPAYFESQANATYRGWDVAKVMEWNRKDSLKAMPYGQRLFQGIMDEPAVSDADFWRFKEAMTATAQEYFYNLIKEHDLHGFVSINNYTAGVAAAAFFPAMTVPMGYTAKGQPYGLTFIAPKEKDLLLFNWAAAYEKRTKHRVLPKNYNN
ncbi:amidase family protein [Nonlabens sp.]|uniref:amidase family protein n=1 Tax=Nonlabens sp. TaxID=1888209 RepID=UPI001BCC832A|nr:amidase family protein [Nonlabens sp.]